MKNKISSILDYSFPSLDPSVFNKDLKLFEYQRDFILRILDKMYVTYNLLQPEVWVEDVVLLGSLSTSKWLLSSDADIHIRVNINKFIETNMPKASKEEAYKKLDLTRKEWDRAKILLPMTNHPTEAYFESVDIKPSNTKMTGVYSLLNNAWIKAPVLFEAGLDMEESKKSVIEAAEALAEELDSSIGAIKRDIQRVNELETVIKAWDKSKQQLFYKKIETKLNNIEEEIKKDLKIKQDLVDARHEHQEATSDVELKFKWLQRFGFFGILQRLKELLESTGGEITVEELPLIEKIVSEASYRAKSWWLDPSGTVYPIKITHAEWVEENSELLKHKYNFNLQEIIDSHIYEDTGEIDWDAVGSDANVELINNGWIRIGDIAGGKGYGVQVASIRNILNFVFDFLLSNHKGSEVTFEEYFYENVTIPYDELPEGQKAVNKALSHKRLQQIASKKEPQKLLIDFDHTLANETKDGSIREPINGAKEALDKLKQRGFEIEIYSVRANGEKGLDEVKEWLDKNQIPYDSIFQGEKPRGTIIDDHAIQFKNNWDEIVNQVEKKAFLYVTSSTHYWVDPSGKIFSIPEGSSHNTWIEQNKEVLESYGIGYTSIDATRNKMIYDGWLRVGDLFSTSGRYQGKGIELKDLSNVPSSFFDFISNFGKEKYFMIEDLQKRYVELSVGDLLQDGQEVINSYLKSGKFVHASLYVTALNAYYHGGSGASIRQMAKDGYVAAPLETGRGHQSPLAGRAYLTKDLGYALIYALGGDMVGYQGTDPHYLDGSEGGIVLVAPNEDTLIPDEDWLGEILTSGYELQMNKGQIGNDIYQNLMQLPVLKPVFDNMSKQRANRFWEMSYQSMLGKMAIRILQKSYPEYLKRLAKESHSMSHEGNLKVLQAWVFDKVRDNPKLKKDGSNFFQIAQEIPVTKTASLKQASINLPTIDPKTFKRKEPYALFIGTQDYGSAGKFDLFDVYGEHPMINEHNQLPTVSLETLVKENIPIIGKEPRAGEKQPHQDISGLYKSAKLFSKKEIIAQTKKVKQSDFGCVMAQVPHEVAQDVVTWGVKNIPNDSIYMDENGNLGRELDTHITIKYGLVTDDSKQVRRLFNNEKPYKATLGKVKHFSPEERDFDVITIEIISEDLMKANEMITESVECAEGLPSDVYHPHITIAYIKKGLGEKYIGSDEFEGTKIELGTLIFSPAIGNKTYFSIGSDKESSFIIEKINKFSTLYCPNCGSKEYEKVN